MSRPAAFFDRDNTLIVSSEFLGDPDRVVLMEGAAACVAALRRLGFAIVTVSNQSGVARGLFDEQAVRAVNARVDELLAAGDAEARIDEHAFCPHHPEGSVERYRIACDCRKPKAGLILEVAARLGLDLERSWLVGDAPRDIEAGAAAGCRTILLSVPGIPRSPAADEPLKVQPDFRAASLAEVTRIIANDRNSREPAARG